MAQFPPKVLETLTLFLLQAGPHVACLLQAQFPNVVVLLFSLTVQVSLTLAVCQS